jgi:hypothetical protein
MTVPDVPFKMLALAPFTPVPDSGYTPRLWEVDLFTLDEIMDRLSPSLYLPVPLDLCPEAALSLRFNTLKDFKPENLVKNNDYLRSLKQARDFTAEALSRNQSPAALAAALSHNFPGLPAGLISVPAGLQAPASRSTDLVDDILSLVATPGSPTAASSDPGSGSWTERLDQALCGLLEAVYNHPDFKILESAWRGLEILVKQGPVKAGLGVKLSIVPVNPDSLGETLGPLAELLAADTPNLVLVDLPLDSTPLGIELTAGLAELADRLLTPTVGWVGPKFFHLDDWAGLSRVQYLKHHLEDAAYAKWRNLSKLPGAAWLGFTLNRVLFRPAYGPDYRAKTVTFVENQPLWVSPVWALGATVAQSCQAFGWPSRFTDYKTCLLKDLPVFDQAVGGPAATEMTLSEDRLAEFLEAGFTPLLGPLRRDTAFLPKEATLAKGSIRYQLFVSRFLGMLFWCREQLGLQERDDPAAALRQTLIREWEKTGQPAPPDLAITPQAPGPEGSLTLKISLSVPRDILPGGQALEFSFNW